VGREAGWARCAPTVSRPYSLRATRSGPPALTTSLRYSLRDDGGEVRLARGKKKLGSPPFVIVPSTLSRPTTMVPTRGSMRGCRRPVARAHAAYLRPRARLAGAASSSRCCFLVDLRRDLQPAAVRPPLSLRRMADRAASNRISAASNAITSCPQTPLSFRAQAPDRPAVADCIGLYRSIGE